MLLYGSGYNYDFGRLIGRKGGIDFGEFPLGGLEPDNEELEEKTKFSLSIYNVNDENKYNIKCNLVNAYSYSGMNSIFCIFGEDIPVGNYSVNFDNLNLTYNSYTICITQNYGPIYVNKTNHYIFGLYQFNRQIFTIDNSKESYELKFNILDYSNERLFIDFNYLYPLEHCKVESSEIKCNVAKSEFESIMIENEDTYKIYYSINETYAERITFVRNIEIQYSLKKEDIYLTITKLLEDVGDKNTYIAYETNVTDIQNVFTYYDFDLPFDNGILNCEFRKYNDSPLLILCYSYYEEKTYVLKEITQEIIVDDLNVKYNFRIQPMSNNEPIQFSGKESDSILMMYPNILDFKLKDIYSINIINREDYNMIGLYGLTFNENASDLDCIRKYPGNRLFVCNVTKSHFSGKKSGYYYIKHTNTFGKKSTNYEVAPIKILLNDGIDPDNGTEPKNHGSNSKSNLVLYISLIIGIIVVLAIIIIVFIILKNKANNKSDKDEKNVGTIGLL